VLGSAYTEPRPLLPLPPPHHGVDWGCMRGWEGAQPGQLTPADHRDILYRMTSCSAIKLGEEEGRVGHWE